MSKECIHFLGHSVYTYVCVCVCIYIYTQCNWGIRPY